MSSLSEVRDQINETQSAIELLETIFSKKLYKEESVLNPNIRGDPTFFTTNEQSNYTKLVCPFHDTDNDGSAYIYHEKNAFECQASGCRASEHKLSPIDLHMALVNGVDIDLLYSSKDGSFFKSLKYLAEKNNIPLKMDKQELSSEELSRRKTHKIRKEAVEIYHESFLRDNKYANAAKEYLLKERGFSNAFSSYDEFIQFVKLYKIGYAGGKYGVNYLYKRLKSKGYSDKELLESGVVKKKKEENKETDEIIDHFSNRLVIPYPEEKGSLFQAAGRSFNNKSTVKYLKFPGGIESPFNLVDATRYLDVFIVEGELDALSLIALGYKNVIATGGTNGLSHQKIKELAEQREKTDRNKIRRFYFMMDEDIHGQESMAKLSPQLINNGFEVGIIRLKDDDPNDLLKSLGQKEACKRIEELKNNALSYEGFMITHVIQKEHSNSMIEKRSALRQISGYLDGIESSEKFFISKEISELLDVDHNWILASWDLPVINPVPQIGTKGYELARTFPWFMVTADFELYKIIKSNHLIENIVFTTNATAFIEELKEDKDPVTNIVVDVTTDRVLLNEIQSHYPEAKFQLFTMGNHGFPKTKEGLFSNFFKLETNNDKEEV